MKLTTRQREVIRKLQAGWKLEQVFTTGKVTIRDIWTTLDVHPRTFFSLLTKGLIKKQQGGYYALTEKGKSA